MAVPELRNNGWIVCPWAEFVGVDGSHGASFASGWDDGTQATFQILVNWTDGLAAEQSIMGFSIWNDDAKLLQRTPPVRHPYKPNLRAERIVGAQPIAWDLKNGAWTNQYITTPAGAPLSEYVFWLMTIGFVAPKYRILDDATLQADYGGQEWRRYCQVEHHNSEQVLSRENGSFFWADSTGTSGGAVPPTRNNAFPAPTGLRLFHDEIHVTWKRLPRRGVYGQSGESDFFNTNILNAWGKVNSTTTLWGLPGNQWSGVLRFVSANARVIPSAFDPGVQGLSANSINEFIDLEFVFDWFDPPYGDSAYRGHNLSPNVSDNYWYLVTTSNANGAGAPAGQTIYPTYDISQAFTLSLT